MARAVRMSVQHYGLKALCKDQKALRKLVSSGTNGVLVALVLLQSAKGVSAP